MVERFGHLPQYHRRKLEQLGERLEDQAWRGKYRKRTILLYKRKGAAQLVEARGLSPLNDQLTGKVEVDLNGFPYLERWQLAELTEDYQILGQRIQPHRDYLANPPKKIPQRLVFVQFKEGVDVLLRTVENVRGKYDPAVNGEIRQMQAVEDLLPRLSGLSQEERDKVVTAFLSEQHLTRPKNPEKVRIATMLIKGDLDAKGRKRFIAGLARQFSIASSIIKRHEAIKAIFAKYAFIGQQVALERSIARNYLVSAVNKLQEQLGAPIFQDTNFTHLPGAEKLQHLLVLDKSLVELSNNLVDNVKITPYSWGARTVVADLGLKLPDGNVSRDMQIKRNVRGFRSLMDNLGVGVEDYQAAKTILERAIWKLQLVLDKNTDYKTVKKYQAS